MKKDFNKFSSRSAVREKAKRELLKMVEETNVGTDHARVRLIDDRSRTGYKSKKNLFAIGIYRETSNGYGFVATEEEERDIFIPESGTSDAIDGDTVKVSYKKFLSDRGEEKTEGRITEILEYGRKIVIGTVESDIVRIHKRRAVAFYLLPDDGKIKRRIFLRDISGCKVGDKVSAKLVRDPYSYVLYADVVANLGDGESKDANYKAILIESEIETEFSPEELEAAKIAASEPISAEGRTVRKEVIFTIDSESAKDLDDAISIEKCDDGTYILGVHIADVSHYVKEKCVLDRLVMRRATSVYFTDKVVPMLPEALSNGACSLNPGEDKYALSAIMRVDASGEVLDTKIEKSIIRSRIKGIYSEINRLFDGTADESIKEKYSECLSSLSVMYELYKILDKRSKARGCIELESPEAVLILDTEGNPVDIVRRERGDAEKLIEQFMLLANESVATRMLECGIPCVFRVHEKPAEDKMAEFINYAHNLGFDTSRINKNKCEGRDLANLISEACERGVGEAVSYVCLRAMAKAVYSDVHAPHFGLGIENYCHFTSPIRRLSDLATHRIIHKVMFDERPPERYKSYSKRAAAAATDGEIRAMGAERRIENLYKVIYMSEHVGEEFSATVTSITSFGVFATLQNTCEGLIPISTMDEDYFFDEKNIAMRSKKNVINIGDNIKIKVEEADLSRGKLCFSLVFGDE